MLGLAETMLQWFTPLDLTLHYTVSNFYSNAAHKFPVYGTIKFYCIVLYCIVLYCIVLYCIVLYCIVLYRPVSFG